MAGEIIFLLPFVLPRVMRPTFLAVLDINNFELGSCFSFYGIVALISYFIGGFIADKFQPKNLMAIALLLTAIGGLILIASPNYTTLFFLYGYWGATTILLFWAALIKATRIWGANFGQGKAFGFLDGGRGLVAAGIATLGVLLFSQVIEMHLDVGTQQARSIAFNQLILYSSISIIIVGLCIYFFFKTTYESDNQHNYKSIKTTNLLVGSLKIKTVWLLMGIVLCAYVGYKTTDFYSLYAYDIMKYSEVESANIASLLLFLRPITAIIIGFVADKGRITIWLLIGFTLMFLGALSFGMGYIVYPKMLLFIMATTITCVGVFACRALYFAAMKAGNIPLALTGTAVGLISIIGYTPDVFVGPLSGIILDNYSGIIGFQYIFLALSCFSLIGIILTFLLHHIAKKSKKIE